MSASKMKSIEEWRGTIIMAGSSIASKQSVQRNMFLQNQGVNNVRY